MLRKIKVKILMVALPDGGERMIPSMYQLKRSIRSAETQLEEIEAQIEESEIEPEKEELRKSVKFLNRSIRHYNRMIEQQPDIEKKAKVETVVINAPTYDELLEFQSAAVVDQEEMPRIDQEKLMELVLQTLFEGGPVPQDPQIVRACWERWKEEAYPDDMQLPFLD